FTLFPDATALGATGSAALAQQQGRAMGEEMRATGVNLDLAPVLDVNSEPNNPIIGLRSFGDKPELVSRLGEAFFSGLHDAGVLAVAKHFPGHGAATQDSHLVLPVIAQSRAALETTDIPPFASAIRAGIDAVLVAHVSYPALEPTGLPASLSKPVVDGLLRGQLGFDGVVITDDLGMRALMSHYSPAEAAVRAIEAGDDLLILTTPVRDVEAVLAALMAAVADGRISTQRLDQSVARILRLKARISPAGDEMNVATAAHAAVARAVSESAISQIAGADPRPNLAAGQSGRLLLVSPSYLPRVGTGTELGAAARRRFPATDEIIVDPDTGAGRAASLAAAPTAAAVVVATAPLNAGHDQFVRSLLAANRRTTLLLLTLPYELQAFPSAPSVLATFGDIPPQLDAAIAVLFGDIPARGRSPVTIPGLPSAP
ncbi:MAG: glycoside hydrolase family 3 protein, partial [Dehalococcoidia bacterium]